jgi:hypothetical protein
MVDEVQLARTVANQHRGQRGTKPAAARIKGHCGLRDSRSACTFSSSSS